MAQADQVLPRLPLSLSKLVGREREVAEVSSSLLSRPLVTVTGPGGVGKSRLAVEVAREVAVQFPGGVHFVELAVVTDLSRVPVEVAATLGIQQVPGLRLGETLAAALAPQQLLLVLDNCEQVASAVAQMCTELLAAADDLRILATSREQLWVDGEVRYRLSPLSVPRSSQPSEMERSAAVALFAERARQADPRFALTPQTASAAAHVVARLDGMPLAIELAAARVEALGLGGLADRIDDALSLLESRNSRAAARHRSLAAVADWSYRLLPWAGQRGFRRLAVFPGPFTLEAAEAVAGPGAATTVLQLVDCSLVTPPRPGRDGRMRYALLQTLRAYGLTQLAEAGEGPQALAALAAFALPVAEQAAAGLATSDDRELAALQWLDAEEATMAAALDWALAHDPETALQLGVAMAPWWIMRGRLADGYARLADAVRVHPDGRAVADAQLWLGYLASVLDNNADSLAHYSAAWETAADPLSRTAILGLAGRALVRNNTGHAAEAADDAQRAHALARQSGDRLAQVRALHALAAIDYRQGARDREALAWIQQAADCLTADFPGYLVRRCRKLQANVLAALGEYDASRQVCEAELAWCRDAGDLFNLASSLEASALREDLAGNAGPMAAYLHEAVEVASRIGHRPHNYLDLGANLCAETGRWADAVTLWAAYAARRGSMSAGGLFAAEDIRRQREYMRQIEAALQPGELRAAQERGSRMSFAAAFEFIALLAAPADAGPPDSGPPEGGELTARERELVTLVAQGRTNAQIAEQLFITVRTVASHLDRIRAKTGCRRRADLTRLALRAGLV